MYSFVMFVGGYAYILGKVIKTNDVPSPSVLGETTIPYAQFMVDVSSSKQAELEESLPGRARVASRHLGVDGPADRRGQLVLENRFHHHFMYAQRPYSVL